MRYIPPLILTILVLGIASVAQRRTDAIPVPTTVHGRVLIDGRSAPQGIRVSLELGGSAVGETTTNSSGQFELGGLNAGLFECIVSQPGYRTAREMVDLRTATSAYTVIDLKPLPDAQGPNVPPEGPAGMMSVKTANLPPEALKDFEAGEKAFTEGKDLGLALEWFKKATEVAPQFAEAYLMKGMAELGQKKFSEAERSFTKAISLDESSAPALAGLGEAQNSQGKFQSAYEVLTKAVSVAPGSAEAQYELAKSLWGLQRWQEAEPHVAKAIALKPSYPDAHVLMGNVLLRKRDAAGALKEFQEYLRLAPNGAMVQPTRELVTKLESFLSSSHH